MFSRKIAMSISAEVRSFNGQSRGVEQRHGAIVDVEVELEPDAEQDVPRVAIVGHARIADRADEHRIELVAQHRVPVRRHGHAGLEVVLGAPREFFDNERAPEDVTDAAEHTNRLSDHFLADSVAGDQRDAHVMQDGGCRMQDASWDGFDAQDEAHTNRIAASACCRRSRSPVLRKRTRPPRRHRAD